MSEVAIIIPTYKPGRYIEKCFKSIEEQSLTPSSFCVYVGLNGPKTEYESFVKEALKKFNFNYKYFYLPTVGVSFARNTLIEESSEDYLVFLDDDDEISSNYLENLLAVTTSTTMGLANVVNFTGKKSNQFENYIGKSFLKLPKKGTSTYKYRKYFSSPCAKMLHRNMIEQIRFDTKLALGEDGFFMANLSKNVKYFEKCSDDSIYYVNIRPSSSSRNKIDKFKDFRRIAYLTRRYTCLFLKKATVCCLLRVVFPLPLSI